MRPGKGSKDFEKWQEEARREERAKCFIVFYGKEFKLRTLSIAGETTPFQDFVSCHLGLELKILRKKKRRGNEITIEDSVTIIAVSVMSAIINFHCTRVGLSGY